MKLPKFIALGLYYGFARYIPNLSSKIGGNKIRGSLCQSIFKECGDNIDVEPGAYFFTGGAISIGSRSGIGRSAYISAIAGGGEIILGSNIMMAPEVVILTSMHNHADTSIPMNRQGHHLAKVVIEDDVWIGYRAMILPGVTVGKGSIIGAGAVVTKDVPPYSVVGGVPARIIKSRIPEQCLRVV